MCRMLVMMGEFSSVKDLMISAFREVCRNDPLNKEADGSTYEHPDGWGYVNIGDSIVSGKSPYPVYNANAIEAHDGIFIIHARKGSTGEPMGTAFTHPFHSFDHENDYWLCHNGDFIKARISEYMGVPVPDAESDTQAFFDLLLQQDGDGFRKLSESVRIINDIAAVKTIENLFLIEYNRLSGRRRVYAYTDTLEGKEYAEHSRLYSVGNGKMRAIFSSSVAFSNYYRQLELPPVQKIPRGKITELVI